MAKHKFKIIKNRPDGSQETFEEDLFQGWDDVRKERQWALDMSDRFTNMDIWNTLSETQQKELSEFRQALRDIPQNYDSLDTLVFPIKPSWLKIEVNEDIHTGK